MKNVKKERGFKSTRLADAKQASLKKGKYLFGAVSSSKGFNDRNRVGIRDFMAKSSDLNIRCRYSSAEKGPRGSGLPGGGGVPNDAVIYDNLIIRINHYYLEISTHNANVKLKWKIEREDNYAINSIIIHK